MRFETADGLICNEWVSKMNVDDVRREGIVYCEDRVSEDLK